MKKILLITLVGTIFAAGSAFGHCGSCEADHGEKAKVEAKAKCHEDTAACKEACEKKKAACKEACEKPCCAKEKAAADAAKKACCPTKADKAA